ncbi:putative leucine-rich repeat protein, partial [Vibrio parahaemolyticus V-223/04]
MAQSRANWIDKK